MTSLLGILVFMAAIVYAFFGLHAYQNIIEKDKAVRFSFPLWFLNKDMFNEYGKYLCPFGKCLFVLTWLGAIVLFVLK